jgi:hypothetical protein
MTVGSAIAVAQSLIDLPNVLNHRRWWRCNYPFRHYRAFEVFTPEMYEALEGALRQLLSKGFSERDDPERFSRNMPYSDAYGWNFPPQLKGPLAIFYSKGWHDMLARLTSVRATEDVNGALHHHQLRSNNGRVHRDLGVGWFSTQRRADGINPMDLQSCTYTHGRVNRPGLKVHETVRAVTMVYYFGNAAWNSGDGGELGLYQAPDDPVEKPCQSIPPLNNSIVVFENTPAAYHSFIQNRRATRNSAILWLHRSKAEAASRWGQGVISTW